MQKRSSFFILFCFSFALLQAQPNTCLDYINEIPDLLQTDKRANFPGGGTQYCAPVAVSNSLVWLALHGFPNLIQNKDHSLEAHFELVKILGSKPYMNTSIKNGTGVYGLLKGLNKYICEQGYQNFKLEYQGWRVHPKKHSQNRAVPELEWIKKGISNKGAVWFNIGWYQYKAEQDVYYRRGGHWVTLVGYGKNEKGKKSPLLMILHDPGPKSGKSFSNQYVKLEKIKTGTLTGAQKKLPRKAGGYYKLASGLSPRKGIDFGIIDGVVVLKMFP